MAPPPGTILHKDEADKGYDCVKLQKSLYGLKQSARVWWKEVWDMLKELGFEHCEKDWGMYYRPSDGVIVLGYVDDMLIAAKTKEACQAVLGELMKKWNMTDLGEIRTGSQILGLKISRQPNYGPFLLSQPAYIRSVAQRFPINTNHVYKSPLAQDDPTNNTPVPIQPYQEVAGCLMWIAGSTRPDIAYAAGYLGRYSSAPMDSHWQAALRVVNYLFNTAEQGIILGGEEKDLEGYVDSDWGGCKETRKSTTGYIFKLNNSPIDWSSKRQGNITSSTLEAEYVAASEAGKQAVFLQDLMLELGHPPTKPTQINCDNQGAIKVAMNPGQHTRTKHIDIRHHLIRELIENQVIKLEYIRTTSQQADFLTKALNSIMHNVNCKLVGIGGMHALHSLEVASLECIRKEMDKTATKEFQGVMEVEQEIVEVNNGSSLSSSSHTTSHFHPYLREPLHNTPAVGILQV